MKKYEIPYSTTYLSIKWEYSCWPPWKEEQEWNTNFDNESVKETIQINEWKHPQWLQFCNYLFCLFSAINQQPSVKMTQTKVQTLSRSLTNTSVQKPRHMNLQLLHSSYTNRAQLLWYTLSLTPDQTSSSFGLWVRLRHPAHQSKNICNQIFRKRSNFEKNISLLTNTCKTHIKWMQHTSLQHWISGTNLVIDEHTRPTGLEYTAKKMKIPQTDRNLANSVRKSTICSFGYISKTWRLKNLHEFTNVDNSKVRFQRRNKQSKNLWDRPNLSNTFSRNLPKVKFSFYSWIRIVQFWKSVILQANSVRLFR